VPVVAERSQIPTTNDPELLIEEARQRQRRRSRRRATALVVAAILAALGFGISQFARGGSSAANQPTPGAAGIDPRPTVLYRKIETVKLVPNLPPERRTVEVWTASNAPLRYRETLTTTGQRRLEIGAGPGHDKVLGTEQIVYFYQPSNNTIYRTGAYAHGPTAPPTSPGADRSYRRYVAEHGAARTLDGRSVYVLTFQRGPNAKTLAYIDRHTFQLLMTVYTGTDIKLITRTVARKVLPATTANLKLTDLALAHPGARLLAAPPEIHAAYALAVNFDNISPDGVSVQP
jgi:hypothetical protein